MPDFETAAFQQPVIKPSVTDYFQKILGIKSVDPPIEKPPLHVCLH
jgi:hypothetical protein